MFEVESSDDLPHTTEIEFEDFFKYRGNWKLWRALGHYDANGSWVAPISFPAAMQLPERMMKTFFGLDDFFERMRRHRAKKIKGGK